MTNERCRLISERQWREYLELVTKCHRLEKQLDEAIGLLEEAHWHVNGDLLKRCIDFIKEYKEEV